MITDTWFNKKTKFFDFDENTYKAIVPINFFDDKTLNGHFGVEFKVGKDKASVVITALEDNPGVDVSIIINLVCMSIYENFIRFFKIKPENVLWVVNRPTEIFDVNLAKVKFKTLVPVIINGQKIISFYDPEWDDIRTLKEFLVLHQLHFGLNLV